MQSRRKLSLDGFVKSPIQPIIVIPVPARRSTGVSVRRRENGNPVNSNPSGLLLPDQVEDKLRRSDRLIDFLRDNQSPFFVF
jgi:hypothetical protein